MDRDWLRMLWSQLQPTVSLQTAAMGLGSSLNCTAPGHCSTKGIESLHNVTRQKCEWVQGLGQGWGGAGGAFCGMEGCWTCSWSLDVGAGVQVWDCLGDGQVCEQGWAGPSPSPSHAVGQASTSSPTRRCPTWPWGWCCWPGPSSCSACASSSWSKSSTPCSRGRWPKPSRRSSTLVSGTGTAMGEWDGTLPAPWPPSPTCHTQTHPWLPLTPIPAWTPVSPACPGSPLCLWLSWPPRVHILAFPNHPGHRAPGWPHTHSLTPYTEPGPTAPSPAPCRSSGLLPADVSMLVSMPVPMAMQWQTSRTRSAGSLGTSPWWWALG